MNYWKELFEARNNVNKLFVNYCLEIVYNSSLNLNLINF